MIVTTDEAAEWAGVAPATIRSWVLRGRIEPVRRGAKPLRFDYADVTRVQRDLRSDAWRRRHAEMVAEWQDACATEERVQR